jgi:EAL and modified HD-GYP domain-containing signal transduction protein
MDVVIAQLPLTQKCKEALRGADNSLGKLLRLAISCERGAWEEISFNAAERGLPEDAIWDIYREACHWSGKILQENSGLQ